MEWYPLLSTCLRSRCSVLRVDSLHPPPRPPLITGVPSPLHIASVESAHSHEHKLLPSRTHPATQKGSIDAPRPSSPNPTETDPRAPEVRPGPQIPQKHENRIFGISESRGFRKVTTCHVFGEKQISYFSMLEKFFGAFSARVRTVSSIEPFLRARA